MYYEIILASTVGSKRQVLKLSSPPSATHHKDRPLSSPVRCLPHITNTDPHTVQSAIRHILATPVNLLAPEFYI